MKARSRKYPFLALLAALALIAAACGDDDSSGPPLTKEEFLTQGDEICLEGDREVEAAARERFGDLSTEPPREEQEAFISEVVAPQLRSQLEQLRDLVPPEGDEEEIEEILNGLEDLADQAESDPGALIDAESPPRASQLAVEYGFQSCGS